MDMFDRRLLRKLASQLPLEDGEKLLDFDRGSLRPVATLPPPFPADLAQQENGRVELGASDRALYLRLKSKTYREGEVARIPWSRLASFGPHRAKGNWKRWSFAGESTNGHAIVVSIDGSPRSSMVEVVARYVDPPPAED